MEEQSAKPLAKAKPETRLQKYFRFNELPATILPFLASSNLSIVDFVTLKLALADIGTLVDRIQHRCHFGSSIRRNLIAKLQHIKNTPLAEIKLEVDFYQDTYWIPIMEFDPITQTMDQSTYRVLELQSATTLKDVAQQLEDEYRAELESCSALDIEHAQLLEFASLIRFWIPFEHCVDLYCMYEDLGHSKDIDLQTTKRGMLASESESESERTHRRLVEIPDDCLRCKVSQMGMFSSIHSSAAEAERKPQAISLQKQEYLVCGYLKEALKTLKKAHQKQKHKHRKKSQQTVVSMSHGQGQGQQMFVIPVDVRTLILNYYKTQRCLIVEKVQLIAATADEQKKTFVRSWPLLQNLDVNVNADDDHDGENWRHFRIGDILDCQDSVHKWYQSVIRKIHPQKKALTVHYIGWHSKFDEVIPMETHTAQRCTHTKSPHRPKRRDHQT